MALISTRHKVGSMKEEADSSVGVDADLRALVSVITHNYKEDQGEYNNYK